MAVTGLPLILHDAVARLDAGPPGGALRVGLGDDHALVAVEVDVAVEVLQRLELQARPAPVHLAVLAELRQDDR